MCYNVQYIIILDNIVQCICYNMFINCSYTFLSNKYFMFTLNSFILNIIIYVKYPVLSNIHFSII